MSSDWCLGFRLSLWEGGPWEDPPVDLRCVAFLNLGGSCGSVTQNVGEREGKLRSSPPLASGSQDLAWGVGCPWQGVRRTDIRHAGLGPWQSGETPQLVG